MKKFYETAKFHADYIFAVGTYGNLPGACMPNLQKLAKQNGYKIDYAESLLMVDNYLPGFDINTETEKLPKKNPDENLARIIADISARKPQTATSPLAWRAISAIIQVFIGLVADRTGARKYKIDDTCTNCGTCAKVCPSGNITVTDKVMFADQCEGCLGCVHLCPKNAIHLKNEKSSARWLHPDVSLAEMVKANNREENDAVS